MADIKITVQGTPNPNAAKFVLEGAALGEGSRSYFDRESAAGDPLAEHLLDLEGVRALFIVDDFITVTKTEDAEWSDVVGRVEEVLLRELGSG
jgi:hypothetical protein